MKPVTSIDAIWRESPETIQKFLMQLPDYEQLCTEVAYTLRKRIAAASIETSDTTWRAKTLKSFHLVCEIQVRTVAQDAWAIIQHHLVYKQESDIPKQLIRRLSRLAAIFEDADEQFERVRREREDYLQIVRSQHDQPNQFLQNELNFDTFSEYLSWKFRDIPLESLEGQKQHLFDLIDKTRYKTLADMDVLVNDSEDLLTEIVNAMVASEGSAFIDSGANRIAIALAIGDQDFRQLQQTPKKWRKIIEEHGSSKQH